MGGRAGRDEPHHPGPGVGVYSVCILKQRGDVFESFRVRGAPRALALGLGAGRRGAPIGERPRGPTTEKSHKHYNKPRLSA
jgi:hypothetical protein